MDKCSVSNCKTTSADNLALFRCPNSPIFLEKWMEMLNLDDLESDFFVCEYHFEDKFISCDKYLSEDAYPTVFLDMPEIELVQEASEIALVNNCRSCFRKYTKDERKLVKISTSIQELFKNATHIELTIGGKFNSSSICFDCYKHLLNFSRFKNDVVKKHSKDDLCPETDQSTKKSEKSFHEIHEIHEIEDCQDDKEINPLDSLVIKQEFEMDYVAQEIPDFSSVFLIEEKDIKAEQIDVPSGSNDVQDHHPILLQQIDCNTCNRSFQTYEILNIHKINCRADASSSALKVFPNLIQISKAIEKHEEQKKNARAIINCEICDFQASTKEVVEHMKYWHPGNTCSHLSLTSALENCDTEMRSGFKREADDLPEVPCFDCGKSMPLHEMLVHCQLFHPNTTQRFSSNFKDPSAMTTHPKSPKMSSSMKLFSIKSEEDGPFHCDKCGHQSMNKLSLFMHMKRNHIPKSVRQCPICGELCKSQTHLKIHKKEVHSEVPCTLCDLKFQSMDEMKIHRRRTHYSMNVPNEIVQCNLCQKSLKKKSLPAHIRFAHHENRKLNFVCHICGKAYDREFDFRSHVTLHTGERPFVCDICGFPFPLRGYLVRHIRQVHMKNPNAPRHKCNLCEKSYAQRVKLREHYRRHHEKKDAGQIVIQQTFACAKCGKEFTRASCLGTHYKYCGIDKRATCHGCGKIFKRIKYLNAHKCRGATREPTN